MAYSYLYIEVKGISENIVAICEDLLQENKIMLWPRVMANSMMLGLICISYYINIKDYSKANECISKTFKIYQAAMKYSNIESKHISHNIAYEFKETVNLLGVCIFMGKLSNFNLNYDDIDLRKKLNHFIKDNTGINSYQYSAFCKLNPNLKIN
jgi:hypothetical protein